MSIWDWLPWLGGGSTLALIAIALLAPGVLTVAAQWLAALSPLLKGAAEGIVAFIKALWVGMQDMLDNAKSIIFVVTLCACSFIYGWSYSKVRIDCTTTKTEIPLPVKKPTGIQDQIESFDSWLRNLFK